MFLYVVRVYCTIYERMALMYHFNFMATNKNVLKVDIFRVLYTNDAVERVVYNVRHRTVRTAYAYIQHIVYNSLCKLRALIRGFFISNEE